MRASVRPPSCTARGACGGIAFFLKSLVAIGPPHLHSMRCPEIGRAVTQVGRPRQRMIFAQMAGLLAMPTLLPEGVLSAEGEVAQAVNSS